MVILVGGENDSVSERKQYDFLRVRSDFGVRILYGRKVRLHYVPIQAYRFRTTFHLRHIPTLSRHPRYDNMRPVPQTIVN